MPRIMAPTFSAAVDSKRSAPRPAQSPTLSPTRSATTAGLRGSSSGMPASAFPTFRRLRGDPASELGEERDEARAEAEAHDLQGHVPEVLHPPEEPEEPPHPEEAHRDHGEAGDGAAP